MKLWQCPPILKKKIPQKKKELEKIKNSLTWLITVAVKKKKLIALFIFIPKKVNNQLSEFILILINRSYLHMRLFSGRYYIALILKIFFNLKSCQKYLHWRKFVLTLLKFHFIIYLSSTSF